MREKVGHITLEDAKSVGQRLSLSKRQIFRLNDCGKIPAPLRIGGAVRWNCQEITNWLDAGAPTRRAWEAMKSDAKREQ